MLNADDPETVIAVQLLKSLAKTQTRPFVFWIGAGSSRWLGYPSWMDLALRLRKTFFQFVNGFDNRHANELLNKNDFPALFQMCRDLDSQAYYRFIADSFAPRADTDLYQTFLDLLGKLSPQFIVTTNVDEALQSRIASLTTVQRSDFARCVGLLQNRTPFVAKLHGSVSSIQSTVFSTDDYNVLMQDQPYLQTLKYIFTSCTVVFLGYSVSDDYVIRLLQQNTAEMNLFGSGPHFVVTNDPIRVDSLHQIKYLIKIHPDHRAVLSILDIIAESATPGNLLSSLVEASESTESTESEDTTPKETVPAGRTAYYLSDFAAPGTWQTSQEITAKGEDEKVIEGSVGLGFTNDEVPFRQSTALHDLVVALVCFDYIYLPLSALTPVFSVLGEDLLRELLRQDVLRFIHNISEVAILFQPNTAVGNIASLTLKTKDNGVPEPLSDRIRRMLDPVPGKEHEAQQLFEELERRTTIYRRADEINFPSLVRSALLMPAVSRLLGIGDAVLPSQVPKWLRYPYLRLAHLVQTAGFCAEYGIQAVKVPFGGVQLITAAFGVQGAESYADNVASYVSSGAFNSDLGALVYQDMRIIKTILNFRSSSAGESFRREVGQTLAFESGREFNASVNAGLRRTIPDNILQQARDQLLRLMTKSARVTPVPAVWGDARQSDTTTRYWRAKSQKILLEMCAARGIGKNDRCICESGEKLRLCCLPPLRD